MSISLETASQTYRRLLASIRPYAWAFSLGVLGSLLYSLVDAYFIKLIQMITDKGFFERDQAFLKVVPLTILAVFLVRGLASFLATYFMGLVGRSVVRDFRAQLLNRMLNLPSAFFDNHSSGELVSKINYDTEQVADALTDAVASSIRGVFTTLALVGVMISISWRLTLVLLTIAPLWGLLMNFVSKRLRRQSGHIQKTMAKLTEVAEEIIKGHKVIRTCGGLPYEQRRVIDVTHNNRRQEMKMIAIAASSVPVMQMIGACALSLLVVMAVTEEGSFLSVPLSHGELVAMVTAMLQLLRPIKQIAIVNSSIQRGIAGAASIFKLLDEPEEVNQGKQTVVKPLQGNLQFENVYFRYDENLAWTLNNINLTIKSGQTVALVGRSGGGKTSILSLLPRFYDVQQGRILIDEKDIYQLDLISLRKQFALVSQNVTLFNDTVAHNIAYGCMEGASEIAIKQAAKAAFALDFIEELPQGFDTLLGENGLRLSGGQRQRIAIARAILRNAPILILDEATSALDSESERAIQAALKNLRHNRTTLVIAHRLSTIENADQIVIIEKGQIVGIGSHQELLQNNSYYHSLQNFQPEPEIEVKELGLPLTV